MIPTIYTQGGTRTRQAWIAGSGKLNLAFLSECVVCDIRSADTISVQVSQISGGVFTAASGSPPDTIPDHYDMGVATLSHEVSNDKVSWFGGKVGSAIVTASGSLSPVSDILNVQGWAWYRCIVTTAQIFTGPDTACWVRLVVHAKQNS